MEVIFGVNRYGNVGFFVLGSGWFGDGENSSVCVADGLWAFCHEN